MLEKYESMLQKVNIEFQNTLLKNKELTNQITILELKCQKADQKALGFMENTDSEKYNLQRQLDELVLEKDEIQTENISLNKILTSKNFEIEELVNTKIELENKLNNNNTENANIVKKEAEWRVALEEMKKKVIEKEYELQRRNEDFQSNSTNYDLVSQTLRKEVEQISMQRDELAKQNKAYQEQIWKESMVMRQLNNENETLKRENLNLKNTIELIADTEGELKVENKFLRESSLAQERKSLLYQNIITQNDKLDISLTENLERSLGLLRSSEEINRGLVVIKIEKMIEEIRSFRFRVRNKIDQV